MNAMMCMLALLADQAVSPLRNAIKITLIVLVSLIALFLIVVILLQPGNSQGIGEISGNTETFLGKNRSRTHEGRLKKLTVAMAIVFVLLILALTIVINVAF